MRECSKCGSRMTEGFVADSGYGASKVSTWQSGEPKKSFWTGLKEDKKAQIEITTWRCERCGYLENYAPRA